MNNARYPQDLAISVQDFISSGWKDVIAHMTSVGYSAMWSAFSSAARLAINQGMDKRGKVFWLIADACSLMLSPSSPNEPFKPFAVFHDRRSIIPDDMHDDDIKFFAEIVDTIDNNWLKARLSDLVWLKSEPRKIGFALKAIDAYRTLILDSETWISGGQDCWPRAINLAQMLRGGAGDRLQQMEESIVVTFKAATFSDGFLGLWLAELLRSKRLGRTHQVDVAMKLETLAHEFGVQGNLHKSREYFSAAADWYKTIPNVAKAAEMTVNVAENLAKEAFARSESEYSGHMIAASLFENAIQTYRTVPRSERASFRVDDRIAELRTEMNISGEMALEEMRLISTPRMDISELVQNSRQAVSGKTVQDALIAFVNLYRGVSVEDLRKSTIERIRQHPLQSLFSASVISSDGRVIAKSPAIGMPGELTDDTEITIRTEMIRDYGILVHLVVQGNILPALEELLLEHQLREPDFISLARNSPFVPKVRAGLFGKALFAGYDLDFVTAIHLLVPQIENLVRMHLKQSGANTTNIDKDGIQNENGMSTLMDLPEAERVFGKDLVFEIKSLFCDAFGPNLRNELAHGLLDEDSCNSPFAIYAWWLVLKLILNTWWNASEVDNKDAQDLKE